MTYKARRLLLLICIVVLLSIAALWSLAMAREASRVAQARKSAGNTVTQLFKTKGVAYPPHRLFFRAFKAKDQLEVWAQPAAGKAYVHVKTYPVCARSGDLGPKRRQGDMQVPEGFYRLDRYNPYSSYHLSMRVNYPNKSDRILGRKGSLGGDIYIHGDCVTIGCLPMTDKGIDELYLMAKDAHTKKRPVAVHIFPDHMDAAGWGRLQGIAKEDKDLQAFWENIRTGYLWFEQHKTLPRVTVDKEGRYHFK